jgi:LmbE family N-acetylglucosaminyl deacetylase
MPAPSEAIARFVEPDRGPIPERVLLIAAHPDDETAGIGAQLHRCQDLVLLHLTDGAPRSLTDARRHGFGDAASYAAARARELQAALAAGGVRPHRCYSLGLPDQSLGWSLVALTRRLARLVAELRPSIQITHAYEGGQPDHDAAAFAAQMAVAVQPPQTRPARLEFAGYHAADGSLAWGGFLDETGESGAIRLSAEERRRRSAMLDCFETQKSVLVFASRSEERLRPAPDYDFAQPPHAGALWYERMDWNMSGAEWRAEARTSLAALSRSAPC